MQKPLRPPGTPGEPPQHGVIKPDTPGAHPMKPDDGQRVDPTIAAHGHGMGGNTGFGHGTSPTIGGESKGDTRRGAVQFTG